MNIINRFFSWLESLTDVFPKALPQKPPNTLLAFIKHYTLPLWPLILVSALLSATIAILEVYIFSYIADIVDWLSTADRDSFWQEHGSLLIYLSIILLCLLPLLNFIYESISHVGLLGNFAMRTRWQMHRYLLRQTTSFFHNDFAGRIATKMMQSALGVRDTVMKIIDVLTYVAVYFISAVVILASSHPLLMMPLAVWLVAYFFILRYFLPRLRQVSQEQAEARSMVTGRVVDSYTHISTVKMFATNRQEDAYARDGMTTFLGPVYQQMRLATLLTFSLSLLNSFLMVAVAATVISLWRFDFIAVGIIAFAIGLVVRLQGMSQWIIWEVAGLFENIGVVLDGIDTISRDIQINDTKDAKPLHHKHGKIEYRNVWFDYEKTNNSLPVLSNFSLTINPGEKVGIVGRSGAGKSTLINLLLRFYDIEQGDILIDDQSIRGLTQESLRHHIGVVTQDTSLLHRSVYENIRYGKHDATDAAIEKAARLAHAHEFILHLNDLDGNTGYSATVGERGVKLSGGQRQRIGIARVLLKDAPILVLDEATSALDSEAEVNIQQSLKALMQNKTVIAIAHRLSTIAEMDRLIVMDHGNIIESGTHHELISQNGLYAKLWQHQSGGFLLADDD